MSPRLERLRFAIDIAMDVQPAALRLERSNCSRPGTFAGGQQAQQHSVSYCLDSHCNLRHHCPHLKPLMTEQVVPYSSQICNDYESCQPPV